jgi:hypothetical protein
MRYLLGLLGIVGLVIVVVILIVRGLSGDDAVKDAKPLTDYAQTNAVMRLTVDGPINADKVHQSVRVTVGQSEAKAEILQSYHNTVANTLSYPNNQQAYGVFLRALDLLNFNVGSSDPKLSDARGFCPDGNLYTLEIYEAGREIQRYWQTSCGEGSFDGELGKISDLFEAQIPDYSNFVQDVEL